MQLLLASSIIGETPEGEEVDLEALAQSLQLALLSTELLMVAIFLPLAVTVYNSFIVAVHSLTNCNLDCNLCIHSSNDRHTFCLVAGPHSGCGVEGRWRLP